MLGAKPGQIGTTRQVALAPSLTEGGAVEVKIGVQYAPRELVLESAESPEDLVAAFDKAITAGAGTFSVVDERGRRVIVPADKLAYLDIAGQSPRGVGFTAKS